VVALSGRPDFADRREADYRLAIAVFGAAMVLLLALLGDGMGRAATLVAAALTALSPALVYYSRYYIQETLLAFFTLGALACGWRYTRAPSIGWAAATGLCVGLMVATKETAILSFAAAAAALWATVRRARLDGGDPAGSRGRGNAKAIGVALSVALFIAVLLLSNFFTNLSAPVDYLRSFAPWMGRAHGTDLHRHPCDYYLWVLLWPHRQQGGLMITEALIVFLALIGTAAALSRRPLLPPEAHPDLLRFIALYTLLLTALYSAIPYKTPWCVLTFLNGLILLAGIGAVVLVQHLTGKPAKIAVCLFLAAGLGHLGWQAYQASYVDFADSHNPYAYAPTSPEVVELSRKVEALARVDPQGDRMVIQVASSDGYYWPLPWYLRRFPNVGYWTGHLSEDPVAPAVLASPEFDAELTQRLDATHLMTGYFALRPGALMQLWVRLDLWKAYMETRKPADERDSAPSPDELK
jgi:uncharacterized protein (TIGR03663 family)